MGSQRSSFVQCWCCSFDEGPTIPDASSWVTSANQHPMSSSCLSIPETHLLASFKCLTHYFCSHPTDQEFVSCPGGWDMRSWAGQPHTQLDAVVLLLKEKRSPDDNQPCVPQSYSPLCHLCPSQSPGHESSINKPTWHRWPTADKNSNIIPSFRNMNVM